MRLFGLITVALVAMAVIAITPVLSQNMNEPTVTKDESGMGEGIKVHGDWQVKVIDPETETENVYAFTNAYEYGLDYIHDNFSMGSSYFVTSCIIYCISSTLFLLFCILLL